MSTLYTCHNCGTTFEVVPDDFNFGVSTGLRRRSQVKHVKVKCPGCYENGYVEKDQMVYTVDLETMELVNT